MPLMNALPEALSVSRRGADVADLARVVDKAIYPPLVCRKVGSFNWLHRKQAI